MSILFKPKEDTESVMYTDNNIDIELQYGDLSVEIGDIVNVRLEGSHTTGFYPCTVCYVSSDRVCLLGNESLGEYSWEEACNLSWDVTIPSNYMYYKEDRVIKDVKIPTIEDIWYRTAGFKRDINQLQSNSGKYWTSSKDPSLKSENGKNIVWSVSAFGNVFACDCEDNKYCVIPYIIIPLDNKSEDLNS